MTTSLPNDTGPELVAMAVLLSRLENELRLLAGAANEFQDAISPAVSDNAVHDAAVSSAIQSVDRIHQTVSGLANFIEHIASAVPEDWKVDPRPACAAVSLEDLAARLKGAGYDHGPPVLNSGDCDYF